MRDLVSLVLLFIFARVATSTNAWILEGVQPNNFRKSSMQSLTALALQCASLTVLSERQRQLCKDHSEAISVILRGISKSMGECERAFEGEIWNCSSKARNGSIAATSKLASKETAYLHALTAASVTHSLATACSKGELRECGCGPLPVATSRSFLWSGCSDNIKFGNVFGRKFLDADDKANADGRSLMNLHNNRVGRRMLSSGMEKACKCHGVSGSCVTKTCWKVVPKMDKFASTLKRKYEGALQVNVARVGTNLQLQTINPSTGGRSGRYLKEHVDAARVARHVLVFLDASPDACENPQEITGRECGSKCSEMCCGRGWHSVRRVVDEPCNCVFHWCCEVKCETCSVIKETHYCK